MVGCLWTPDCPSFLFISFHLFNFNKRRQNPSWHGRNWGPGYKLKSYICIYLNKFEFKFEHTTTAQSRSFAYVGPTGWNRLCQSQELLLEFLGLSFSFSQALKYLSYFTGSGQKRSNSSWSSSASNVLYRLALRPRKCASLSTLAHYLDIVLLWSSISALCLQRRLCGITCLHCHHSEKVLIVVPLFGIFSPLTCCPCSKIGFSRLSFSTESGLGAPLKS